MHYKEFSSLLNEFCSVEPEVANFNIPYAVSNGFIVYRLDIVSKIGEPGDGALKSCSCCARLPFAIFLD